MIRTDIRVFFAMFFDFDKPQKKKQFLVLDILLQTKSTVDNYIITYINVVISNNI